MFSLAAVAADERALVPATGDNPNSWLDGLYDDKDDAWTGEVLLAPTAKVAIEGQGGMSTSETIDSGASRHMSSLGSRFVSLQNTPPHPITAAKGKTFYATAKGDYVIKMPQEDGTHRDLLLKDTLYARQLQGTLVSVSAIDAAGCEARFGKGVCRIVDPNGRVLGVVCRQGGLYQVQRATANSANVHYALATKNKPLTYMELHCIMGHASPTAVKAQYLCGGLKGVDVDESSEIFDCELCTMGKLRAPSVPKIRKGPRSKTYGEWWYADIWGPSPVASGGGKLYADIYTDNATHWRVIYFYRKRDEAESTVLKHMANLKLHDGVEAKFWITDQAGEYKEMRTNEELNQRGIEHL